MLRKVRNLIKPSIIEDASFKKAFEEVELGLKQSKNPVPAQNPNQNNTDKTTMLEKDIQLSKEELKSFKEELMQQNAIADLKKQSLKDSKTFVTVSRMLGKSVSDFMNSTNSVPEHFLQREDGQLILNFCPTLDSIQTNQSGKMDDIHNSEMIGQEELRLEVDLTLVFVGVRPEKLILKTQRGQKMAPVTIGNEVNMNLSSDKRFFVDSKIQSYEVKKDNVDVLDRIFKQYPDTDKEFKLKYPYFQSVLMNEIAETFKSIENRLNIFEPEDIGRMYKMVKDMELTGLEITGPKNGLKKVHQNLRKILQEHLNELDTIDEARS